ncbi:PAS domain-containing protein [Polaromonas sp.]|uniref:helix-turn-helix transcriptional regulator n=1 Tax=Polaromonas sp. TaxID=1869339 RepID=UPI0032675DBD
MSKPNSRPSTQPSSAALSPSSARSTAKKPVKRTPEQAGLLEQLQYVAQGLSETFAPFCEVVLHDLLDPKHSILAIHNNLSGRRVGDPTTELGLARIADPSYQQVISNYANQFADGRQAKSTSVGIRDSSGRYIAALCMNVDLTLFRSLQNALGQFSSIDTGAAVTESLDPAGADVIRARIDQFAARLATTPRSLKADERRALLKELKDAGCMDIRRAMEITALHLGVSRAAVYSYAK